MISLSSSSLVMEPMGECMIGRGGGGGGGGGRRKENSLGRREEI